MRLFLVVVGAGVQCVPGLRRVGVSVLRLHLVLFDVDVDASVSSVVCVVLDVLDGMTINRKCTINNSTNIFSESSGGCL